MGETTTISWCDATVNFWIGCTKVSQGCDNCYAETLETRYGHDFSKVRRTSDASWKLPFRLEKRAVSEGQTILVFTCSMSDFFHRDADPWRAEAWDIMRATPHLTYQVLTKRPARALQWYREHGWLPNVWIGTSVENQQTTHRIKYIAQIDAPVRFLSVEPMLSRVDITRWLGYNPIHEEQEYRELCLSCGYQWRIGHRSRWASLAGLQAGMGSMDEKSSAEQVQPSEGGKRHRSIFTGQGDVRQQTLWSPGASARLDTFLWGDTVRSDHKSQEWEQEGQQTKQPRISNLQRTAIARDPHLEGGSRSTSEGREQFYGEAHRCPSCGDSTTTLRRGNTILDSQGFWCPIPAHFKDRLTSTPLIFWAICGGESGPDSVRRPMALAWARDLQEQCAKAGVAFFFKQISARRSGQGRDALGRLYEEFPEASNEHPR